MATIPSGRSLTYVAVDAVIKAFHEDQSPVAVIRAARATTKSTACQIQLFTEAMLMPPQEDGVRRSAFLITRTSYRDLEQSAVATYKERFEGVVGMRPLSGREPWSGGISMKLPDGTQVESTWLFMAVPPDDLGKLGSMQFTSAYINELMDYQEPGIVSAVQGSCGRYPSKDGFSAAHIEKRGRRPLYRSRVICDTNGPFENHWLREAEDNPPATWRFFIQEPPLLVSDTHVDNALENRGKWYYPNPKATYHKVIPKGYQYWLDMVPGAEDWYIESRVLGQYSKSVSGKRVYSAFNEDMVLKAPPKISEFTGTTLMVGIDTSGNHPAAVVTAYKDAALWVLDEVGEQDIAFEVFVDEYLIPLLASKYAGFDMVAILDPSNPQSGIDKRTALMVCIQAGLDARLAHTNFFGNRTAAVNRALNKRNGFFISPTCRYLVEGFRGHYHYAAVRGQPGVHKLTPNKSVVHADYHDGLQYAALGYELERNKQQTTPVRVKASQRRAI